MEKAGAVRDGVRSRADEPGRVLEFRDERGPLHGPEME